MREKGRDRNVSARAGVCGRKQRKRRMGDYGWRKMDRRESMEQLNIKTVHHDIHARLLTQWESSKHVYCGDSPGSTRVNVA